MWDFLDWTVIGFFLLALLLSTLSVYVVYSGLLTEVHISTGSSPVKSMTVAYKYQEGPYKESGLLFAESCRIAPELPTVGVFYDDPKKVPAPKCRCAVGSILSEGDQRPSAELQELYEKFGFRIFTFPEVTHVVSSCFPYRTRLSIILGVCRVYPQLNCYIKDRKLCAHPFLEIYRNQLIYYISPLARQGDFYVPEVQKAPKRQQEGEESEEDRRTDITGADSHSDCSSVSGPLQSHSRDTSPSLSLSPSVLYHQHRDSLSDSDSGSRRSRRSSSASSFEELQLEAEKCVTSDGPEHPGPVVEGEE
ncbi:testis-expressed protein 264 homolog [Hemibagrus wyckioides]|uniref:testis-expressed protein 264 homolog n=1 Tax=Hemibagrus wyckioides TaxID=337641 RepID=UPI00266D9B5E|nr:testis-expressed protein 264 homolog [Hemibagrus wyckioides]